MRILITIFSVFGLFIAQNVCAQNEAKPLVLGEYFSIESKVLDEPRRINIYLPHTYGQDSTKYYPVIYLLDGSLDEDFIHIVGLVQFCSFSWIEIIQESIVVGISNVDRKRDFTYPTSIEQDKIDFPTSGGSSNFIDFIESELIPEVNSRYRTDKKTLIGQSLGGLLATEILAKKPHLFDNYMIISPSLWWDNQSLLDTKFTELKSAKKVYVAVGNEGEIMVNGARKLYQKLTEYKWPQLYSSFEYFDNKTHGDVLHQAVYNGFVKFKVVP